MWTPKSQGKYENIDLETRVESLEQTAFSNPAVQQRSVFAEAAPSKKPEFVGEAESPQDLS